MAKNSINEIAAVLARKHQISKKDAADIVTAFFNTIEDGLRDDRQVKVRGLGTFKVTTVKARESVNVNTGERVVIEGHDKVSFVPDQSMKDLVNKPFAQFTTVVVNDGVNFDSVDAASAAEERKTTVEESSETEPDLEEENDLDAEAETSEPDEADDETTDEEPETEQAGNDAVTEEEPQPEPEPAIIDEAEETSDEDEKQSEVIESVTPEPEPVINFTQADKGADDVKPIEFSKGTELSNQSADAQQSGSTLQQSVHEEHRQISDQHSQVVDQHQTATEETSEKSAGAEDEDNVSREYFDEQMASCRRRCNRNLVLSLVLLIVGLVAGFFAGRYIAQPQQTATQPAKDSTAVAQVTKPAPEPVAAPEAKDSVQPKDTAKVAEKKEEKVEEPEPKQEPEKTEDAGVDPDIKKLNSDRRLRFGAYEILGVDKVITLKKGQTMQSYSNKTLGKDMVVYFQVLNGVDDAKAGDRLKVPKIRLKKQYRK